MDEMFDIAAGAAKPSTPAERAVIFWLVVIVCVGVGAFCLYLGFTAPPGKAAAAGKLRLYGYGFVGFAVLLWVVRRVVRWAMDRWV